MRHKASQKFSYVLIKSNFVSPLSVLASFIVGLFNLYEDLYFTYLEINPLGKTLIYTQLIMNCRNKNAD